MGLTTRQCSIVQLRLNCTFKHILLYILYGHSGAVVCRVTRESAPNSYQDAAEEEAGPAAACLSQRTLTRGGVTAPTFRFGPLRGRPADFSEVALA
jgi:hypothetical protein